MLFFFCPSRSVLHREMSQTFDRMFLVVSMTGKHYWHLLSRGRDVDILQCMRHMMTTKKCPVCHMTLKSSQVWMPVKISQFSDTGP